VLADAASDGARQIHVIGGKALRPGWTGKLWAINQDLEYAQSTLPEARYFLLTDADVVLKPGVLRQLGAKADDEKLDLVSLMALLHCRGLWERLLMPPAFVFFFQIAYPFLRVNDPKLAEAGAAGDCMPRRSKRWAVSV
jgi:hypothetical protein